MAHIVIQAILGDGGCSEGAKRRGHWECTSLTKQGTYIIWVAVKGLKLSYHNGYI